MPGQNKSLNYRRGRSGRPYERAKARNRKAAMVCARCGGDIDPKLPHRDPETGRVNLMSLTFGHVDELDAGGHPYKGRPEHLTCNSKAGAEYGNAKKAAQKPTQTRRNSWRRR